MKPLFMLSLFLSFNAVASYTEENNYPECKPSRNYEIVDSKIIKTDDFEEEDVPDLSQLGPYTVEAYLDIICQDNIAYYDDGYGLLDDEGEALYQTTVSGYRTMHLKVTTPSDNFPFYVLRDYSGGMHCCFNNFFLSKDKPYRILQELFSYDSKLKYSDLDGDGALEIMLHDSIFSYWKTCYACSRSIKVIYRVNEEGLLIAQDLMRQEMQHPTVELALKKIRKELAKVKPESDMGISMGFNQRLHDIGVFTARFLYAGMREEAWQFFDQIWNEQEKYLDISKLDFEIELLEQIFGSKHYQLLVAKNPKASSGWVHEGRVLPSSVFKKQWTSSDNFEEFEEHFKIETKDCWTIEEYGVTFCRSEDFRNNPGKYFGKEIKDLDPIKAWDGYISLAVSLDAINFNQPYTFKETDHGTWIVHKTELGDERHKLIDELSIEECKIFAPFIKGECRKAYAVYVGDWRGGSMGHQYKAGIYGLFELEDGKEYIVPLKYLPSREQAMINDEDKAWLKSNSVDLFSLRDVDFDGEDELVMVSSARGNRGAAEFKAYNLSDNELVLHFREGAVFDSKTKTVVNRWYSNYCTHEAETYQAMNNTLEMVRLEFSDYEPDGYGCILRIFERSSDSGNKSLQDFDDESLRITGEKRYGIAGANLELVDTKCWKNEVWRQCH